jgi:hypothetical protein
MIETEKAASLFLTKPARLGSNLLVKLHDQSSPWHGLLYAGHKQ